MCRLPISKQHTNDTMTTKMKMKWELQQVESSLVYCAGVCVCVCICGEEEISFRLMRRGDSWWRTHKHANNITLKWHRRKKRGQDEAEDGDSDCDDDDGGHCRPHQHLMEDREQRPVGRKSGQWWSESKVDKGRQQHPRGQSVRPHAETLCASI